MEDYFERVVETLTGAGYRWYETANFCSSATAAIFARGTTSATGSAATISGSASAPSRRSRARAGGTRPALPRYLAALGRGERPQRELEQLEPETAARERVMLGLRLDEPLELAGARRGVDREALARLRAARPGRSDRRGRSSSPAAGRFLGGGVTAELLVES